MKGEGKKSTVFEGKKWVSESKRSKSRGVVLGRLGGEVGMTAHPKGGPGKGQDGLYTRQDKGRPRGSKTGGGNHLQVEKCIRPSRKREAGIDPQKTEVG